MFGKCGIFSLHTCPVVTLGYFSTGLFLGRGVDWNYFGPGFSPLAPACNPVTSADLHPKCPPSKFCKK